jgi:hypothetical protein
MAVSDQYKGKPLSPLDIQAIYELRRKGKTFKDIGRVFGRQDWRIKKAYEKECRRREGKD